jgi:hypothetical protein
MAIHRRASGAIETKRKEVMAFANREMDLWTCTAPEVAKNGRGEPVEIKSLWNTWRRSLTKHVEGWDQINMICESLQIHNVVL